MLNRTLVSTGEGVLPRGYICRVPTIQFETACTVAELVASYEELARKTIRHVYELFNWTDSSDDILKQWQERLANRRF